MAPRKKKSDDTAKLNLPALGEEGDSCGECGSALATDQRYCLNCGTRRAGPRVDFTRAMAAPAGAGPAQPFAAAGAMRPAYSNRDWTIAGVGLIAIMGIFLLVGVLIGRDDDGGTTQAAAPAATATTAPTTATPAAVTPVDKAAGADKAANPAGANKAVAGGSGSTEGIPTADLSQKTGKEASDAAKNGPNVVATPGDLPEQDPNGEAGGGGEATCLGGPC